MIKNKLISPHGSGKLAPLLAPPSELTKLRNISTNLVWVPLTSRERSDLLLLAMGALNPLDGFLNEEDWHRSCSEMRLSNGILWPIPITKSIPKELAKTVNVGDEVVLFDPFENNRAMAILQITDIYKPDLNFECQQIYGTLDRAHPGANATLKQEPINIAGKVVVFDEGSMAETYSSLYLRPKDTRVLFNRLGWKSIAAFQTRNPMHRSHEHLVKLALELTDGVFIHQVLGRLKDGDYPPEVRTVAIDTLVKNYFPSHTVIQGGYPIHMRYAGPREALLHAIIRQNFGCSHLIVGRDHAGIGGFYGLFDSQNIFDTLWVGALKIIPLKFDVVFYCKACESMASAKSCPHPEEQHLRISGTRFREMINNNEEIPPEFSRPEIVSVIKKYYENKT
ncbi:MAG: sulfate adenylyltransferase [Pseudomonadota bacterium]|nr:sulfate adenylyltransferase [Pseudomonadota bacterium]